MDRFITLTEAERLTSLRKSQLYAMMKIGTFPRSYKLTSRRRGWRESDIQGWIKSRDISSMRPSSPPSPHPASVRIEP